MGTSLFSPKEGRYMVRSIYRETTLENKFDSLLKKEIVLLKKLVQSNGPMNEHDLEELNIVRKDQFNVLEELDEVVRNEVNRKR